MSKHISLPEDFGNYEQYLQHIADLDISPKEKFELLCIVHSLLSYFVDQAFGVQTDQITMQSAGKICANASLAHVSIQHEPEHHFANVQSNDVELDCNAVGSSAP